MARKKRYHYYTVAVPSDLSGSEQVKAEQAITEARERARLYILPCDWHAVKVGENCMEDIYRVTRISRAPARDTVSIYVVCENTPGYLPDDEPYWTKNKRDAARYAASLARRYKDEYEDGKPCYLVQGSAYDGHGYTVQRNDSDTDLGRVIDIRREQVTREDWEQYQQDNA
jgi:hypothetical protein